MNDNLGTDIAMTLYEDLYSDINPTLIAYALDKAVQKIRTAVNSDGTFPLPSTWAPFIHVGL